jgi:DNA-binding beta-propeller fold protein YncE
MKNYYLFVLTLLLTVNLGNGCGNPTGQSPPNESMTGAFMGSDESSFVGDTTMGESVTEVYRGIKRPHGIGAHLGTIYVSSEADKKIYAIKNGAVVHSLPLNFTHDMVFVGKGGYLTAVFFDNTVVRVLGEKHTETLVSNLSGPNGLAVNGKHWFVSNYLAGNVVQFTIEEQTPTTLIQNLNGPAGMVVDEQSNTLYVAEYIGNQITTFNLKTQESSATSYSPLNHIESLFIDFQGRLLGAGILDGQGVIAVLNKNGTFDVLIETGLPEPIVAHLDENDVYIVSPSDKEGKILRATL